MKILKLFLIILKVTLSLNVFGSTYFHIPHFYHVQVKPFTSTLRIFKQNGFHVITFAVEELRPWFCAHLNFEIGGTGLKQIVLHIKNERNRTVQVPEIEAHILELVKNRMKVFLHSFSMLNPIEYTTFIEDLEKVGLTEKELYEFLVKN